MGRLRLRTTPRVPRAPGRVCLLRGVREQAGVGAPARVVQVQCSGRGQGASLPLSHVLRKMLSPRASAHILGGVTSCRPPGGPPRPQLGVETTASFLGSVPPTGPTSLITRSQGSAAPVMFACDPTCQDAEVTSLRLETARGPRTQLRDRGQKQPPASCTGTVRCVQRSTPTLTPG